MGTIRVLVVDDSALARGLLVGILTSDDEIEVVGEAVNGREAVDLVAQLRPHLVTMDLEMPVMGGLEAIERIMSGNAVPILVVTSRSDSAAAHTAISKGALDVVAKPDVGLSEAPDFIAKVKLLSKINVVRHLGRPIARSSGVRLERTAPLAATRSGVVAIASSTGGPLALSVILGAFPEPFPCPIVIAQHHSDGFVPGMVEWFQRVARIPVKLAENGEALVPGTAYVSPSERHMQVTPSHRVALEERQPEDVYRPSCDALLSSVARSYGARAIGVILTGMGSDGANGMQDIKAAGGVTIAQNEESCAIFGMPRVAIERGCIDKVLSLDRIASEIVSLVARAHGPRTAL